MTRLAGRCRVLGRALASRLAPGRRSPHAARRILVAHHLLAGDTFMLTPLLAKVRARHPAAEVVMTVRPSLVPLYAGRPYGVRAVAFDPHDAGMPDALLDGGGFDLALVPGDNRFSWLAAAAGARWIAAFAGDRPAAKSWMVDELRVCGAQPAALADLAASLVDGPPPAPYRRADWPPPPAAPFERPPAGYSVLHVGAGSPLRLWQPDKWRALAERLASRGQRVVWSAGPGEEGIVDGIDPERRHARYAGKLDLAQLWHLLADASQLVTLDTGVAHLAKLVGVPTVALFGPGSALLFGRGEFWRDAPFREVTIADFPCRDQRTLFKRRVEWVRRCQRPTSECPRARCMHAIGLEQVMAALEA